MYEQCLRPWQAFASRCAPTAGPTRPVAPHYATSRGFGPLGGRRVFEAAPTQQDSRRPHLRPCCSLLQAFKFATYLSLPIALTAAVVMREDILQAIIKSVSLGLCQSLPAPRTRGNARSDPISATSPVCGRWQAPMAAAPSDQPPPGPPLALPSLRSALTSSTLPATSRTTRSRRCACGGLADGLRCLNYFIKTWERTLLPAALDSLLAAAVDPRPACPP